MRHEEDTIQKSICAYLDVALPPTHRFFAVPNGGVRNIREAARLKAGGVRPGVPDLVIVSHNGHCAFLEVKRQGGSLSPAQREWRDWCACSQIPYAIVSSINEVEQTLTSWNIRVMVTL